MNPPQSPPELLVGALARQLDMTPHEFETPGTTVTFRDDRAGTGQVAIYRVGAHTILWADPALEGQIDRFAHPAEALELVAARDQLLEQGYELLAGSLMRAQDTTSAAALVSTADALCDATPEFRSQWLADGDDEHLALIAELASKCTFDDLEQADMEDLDEFEGDPIHGIFDPDGALAALAYATPWDWDPLFCDVGVLVDPTYRNRRLGVRAIAGLAAAISGHGHIPLYRHEDENAGSAALATRLGFETVLDLCVVRQPPA